MPADSDGHSRLHPALALGSPAAPAPGGRGRRAERDGAEEANRFCVTTRTLGLIRSLDFAYSFLLIYWEYPLDFPSKGLYYPASNAFKRQHCGLARVGNESSLSFGAPASFPCPTPKAASKLGASGQYAFCTLAYEEPCDPTSFSPQP